MTGRNFRFFGDSGPVAIRAFHRLFSIVCFIAWASLGSQILVLCGANGLLPAGDLVRAVAERPDVSFLDFPTLFRFGASDGVLVAGTIFGAALSVLALFGVLPRLAFALSTVMYLSYAVICRDFLSFQWDNLLIECGALASILPVDRRSRFSNLLFRLLLFKLYFESGIAKYQSYLGDWKDGSAMSFYYETAPLPTRLAWYAHHLPASWHRIESWATLAIELGFPVLIFLPRPFRLLAACVFTAFQGLNILTANYGFFAYLAIALHVFLLDDRDVTRLTEPLRRARRRLRLRFPQVTRLPRLARVGVRRAGRSVRAARLRAFSLAPDGDTDTLFFLGRLTLAALVGGAYVGTSYAEALRAFTEDHATGGLFDELAEMAEPLRIVNVYHLFGHITRERIEPTFEIETNDGFREFDLRYKPGDPARAPPFVAPHQPRVDFLLWFYGLSYERGVPLYVRTLLVRLCEDPKAVAPLFVDPLPPSPSAVRVAFYRYHFTTRREKSERGTFWTREPLGESRTLPCREP